MADSSPPRNRPAVCRPVCATLMSKTLGELYLEIDTDDAGFKEFVKGWDAAVLQHSQAARLRGDRPDCDQSAYSMAQVAQVWGFYTGQIVQEK